MVADTNAPDVHRAQLRREAAERLDSGPAARPAPDTDASDTDAEPENQKLALHCTLVSVDGPATITVQADDANFVVQLYGIKALDAATIRLQAARQFMHDQMQGKALTIYPQATGPYGVISGWVFNGPTCINRTLIAQGYAAWDQDAAPDAHKLQTLQAEAKTARRGLWANP